jgi:hypothetical protein
VSRYKLKEHRVLVTPEGEEPKNLFFGWDVVDTKRDDEVQNVNDIPLAEDDARKMAATLEWANHLDSWMTTLVEDEDVVEEIGAILGLDEANGGKIAKVLELLPDGLRLLATTYEIEWRKLNPSG